MEKEITIQWLDNGYIEDVIVKIGDFSDDDDYIFFYFESEEEMEHFKVKGANEFIIIEC